MFNTFYAETDYLLPLNADWKLRLGAQFTDQRAVGNALLPPAQGKYWVTHTGGTRRQLTYRELTLTAAFAITGGGNNIQTPWGSFPGYVSMIDQDFDRAGEKARRIGAAYDFSKLLTPGLSANVNLAWGIDAINPSNGKTVPNQAEYDLTTDYRPPFKAPVFHGMWFRFRTDILDQQDAKTLGYQFRIPQRPSSTVARGPGSRAGIVTS